MYAADLTAAQQLHQAATGDLQIMKLKSAAGKMLRSSNLLAARLNVVEGMFARASLREFFPEGLTPIAPSSLQKASCLRLVYHLVQLGARSSMGYSLNGLKRVALSL